MLEKAKNNQGNISIAIVIAIIAVLSGVSMAALAFRDTNSFRHQLEAAQQFHILRAEVGRGRLMSSHYENMETPPVQNYLPIRLVPLSFGNYRTVYRAKTRIDLFEQQESQEYLIRSLITAVRGPEDSNNPDLKSPVSRYSENKVRSLQTIALFHYFSDIDRYFDDRPGGIVFWAGDIIHGRVHSNTDIYLRNNSWPRFYGLVSTAGRIRVSGGGTNYPRDQIFLGPAPALIENHPRIAFESDAELVRRHGGTPFGTTESDESIAYVTVQGRRFTGWIADIFEEDTSDPEFEWEEDVNQFTIYSSYPPYGPIGDSIGVNQIPRKDTVWTARSGAMGTGGSIFVPMELWISGNFGGRQTWASSHNIYLKGDLTYERTIPGQPPDGGPDGNYPVNSTDYLGIISEESIYIQYGHKHPYTDERLRPNTEDIYMYGAYCAVGESDYPWLDGVVTIQYWRPKGSTPPQEWQDEFYKFIDLHLFHYPTTRTRPWPQGLDYPWYNPLWPEPGVIRNVPGLPNWTPNPHNVPEVVEDRGAIYIFGSIAQRRRGAVGFPPGNMFDVGIWDIDNTINPHSAPTYGTFAPNRVGYDKRYTEDARFQKTGPPHYPLIKYEGYDSDELRDLGYETVKWVFSKPPRNF